MPATQTATQIATQTATQIATKIAVATVTATMGLAGTLIPSRGSACSLRVSMLWHAAGHSMTPDYQ